MKKINNFKYLIEKFNYIYMIFRLEVNILNDTFILWGKLTIKLIDFKGAFNG